MPDLRKATFNDQAGVLALYRELRPNDPEIPAARVPALWAAVTDSTRSSIFIASVDGEVAATCMLATVANLASDGRPIGLIEHVITAGRYRRRGLARLLLEHALKEAWHIGCCKVLLLSGMQRTEAHGLYESVGFRGDVERGFVAKPGAAMGAQA
ncbi:MAG: family N-acetyltransferase [Rhodoferax sp.]|nr:family N-acetyltransferase [Rhodoferax sp.]